MDGVTAEYPVTLKQYIPERAGYVDMHLSFLCTFLPLASVALITTNRHAIRFICRLKPLSPNMVTNNKFLLMIPMECQEISFGELIK